MAKLEKETPVYLLELLIALGLTNVPSYENFDGTNLQGANGKHICELPQSILEKVALYAAGFTRDIVYVGKREIVIESTDSAQESLNKILKIVEFFLNQNFNVGIRVHKINKDGVTSKSVARVAPGDENYLFLLNGTLRLKLIGGELEELELGDKLQIFSSPVSVNRKMNWSWSKEGKEGEIKEEATLDDKKNKEEKTINLGGGFVCSLNKYDAVKEIFTLTFSLVSNGGDFRNVEGKDKKYPELKLDIDVKEKDGKFTVVNQKLCPNLDEAVNSGNLYKVLECVAGKIIDQESVGLFKLFSTALGIYPKLRIHAVQGLYAIEENDDEDENYTFRSITFDIASGEQAGVWNPKGNLSNIKNPGSLLQSIYKRLGVEQRELGFVERLLLAQLVINGLLEPVLATITKTDEPFIRDSLLSSLKDFEDYVRGELLVEDEKQVIKKASAETEKIISSLAIDEHEYKSNSAEALFGELLWLTKSEKLKKVYGNDNMYEISSKGNRAWVFDLGDYKIGFLFDESGKLLDLKSLISEISAKGNNESRKTRMRKLGRLISKKFGLRIVEAMYEFV